MFLYVIHDVPQTSVDRVVHVSNLTGLAEDRCGYLSRIVLLG